jgi:hypothetical protein
MGSWHDDYDRYCDHCYDARCGAGVVGSHVMVWIDYCENRKLNDYLHVMVFAHHAMMMVHHLLTRD